MALKDSDKWSLIKLMFVTSRRVGYEGLEERRKLVRLLTEVFLKERRGWFTAWTAKTSLFEDANKYIVLGGVRCDDVEEAKAVGEVLRRGLSTCNCWTVGLWWSELSEDWRGALKENPWDGPEKREVAMLKGWIGDKRLWLRKWEAFGVDEEKLDQWLQRADFYGDELGSMEVLLENLRQEYAGTKRKMKRMGVTLSQESRGLWLAAEDDERRRIEERLKRITDSEVMKGCDTWWAKLVGDVGDVGDDGEEYRRKRLEELRRWIDVCR